MLVHVEAFALFLFRDTQANSGLDDCEHNRGCHEDECCNRYHSDDLTHELVGASAVEETLGDEAFTFFVGKQSDGNRAERPAHAVHRDRAYRVVDSDFVKERHRKHHDDSAHQTNDQGTDRRNCVTACSDADQTCEQTVASHRYVGFAGLQSRHKCSHNGSGTCGDQSGGGDATNHRVSAELGAGIKPEPTDQQNKTPDDGERNRVPRNRSRFTVGAVTTDAWAESLGCCECCHTTGEMHDG